MGICAKILYFYDGHRLENTCQEESLQRFPNLQLRTVFVIQDP